MIPVTILTGFLGSGKTTLLNRILTAPHGRRIAVVVNEFGDIGLDQKFIARAEGDIVELTNGCVCCSARNDTVEILLSLVSRARQGQAIDHVVIETTGLAKPAALARFFMSDSPLKNDYRLDAIVTLVDAFHGTSQLIQYREAKEQVAVADLIVLNKTDLSEEPQRSNLREWLRGLNPTAPIVAATHGDVALDTILDIGGFNLAAKAHILGEADDHDHVHDTDITAISIREERPLDRGKFARWLAELVAMEGVDLLRYKGIISFVGAEHRAVLQGVHMIYEFTDGGPWPAGDSPMTELVFIGRRLMGDVIREGVRNSVARG